MKTCFKCHKTLSISKFYCHPRMKDGHLNKCIECTKKDVAERIKDKTENDIEWIIEERERCRIKSEKARSRGIGSKSNQEMKAKWIRSNPVKKAAHIILKNAVKNGRISRKPCEVCGNHKSHAHHEDYLQPFDVIWLCPKHHGQRHVQINEERLRKSFGK